MEIIKVNCTEPIRLDRYLRRIFPQLTQGIIEKLLRSKRIKLNGLKSASNARVLEGDEVTILLEVLPPSSDVNSYISTDAAISLAHKLKSDYLIYEDERIIAINKPRGLAVQGGSKIAISVDDALSYLNNSISIEHKLKITHRLDKETSGILLIAKGYENAAKLAKAFKERVIKKKYVAIVEGKPKQHSGKITSYIARNASGVYEVSEGSSKDGKLAETLYQVRKTEEDRSCIEFTPLTGRMHQLRLHARQIGCPIVGDIKYGGPQHSRMMLHAEEIIIPDSVFGYEIKICCDAKDLRSYEK